MTKTQLDRLGDRIKKGNLSDEDLRLLDEYRRSFADAYENVVGSIKTQLSLEPTGRPAKSTTSIADKLSRESIRLTQIQDISGCRLVVSDIAQQNTTVDSIRLLFADLSLIDRREIPSHGYRAVHVVVRFDGKPVEIQIRTKLQHRWAELSEKLSDVFGHELKYGSGNSEIRQILDDTSKWVVECEASEVNFIEITSDVEIKLQELKRLKLGRVDFEKRKYQIKSKLNRFDKLITRQRERILTGFRDLIEKTRLMTGNDSDISN